MPPARAEYIRLLPHGVGIIPIKLLIIVHGFRISALFLIYSQMSCPEIDLYRRQVCQRLGITVNDWHTQLQSRYGDPRVYAQQQAEMNRIDAEVAHDLSRRNSNLLDEAYEKQRLKMRESHHDRMAKTRATLRKSQKTNKRPESQAAKEPRTSQLPDARSPAPSEASAPPAASSL